jgi:hypothetical protein
MEGAFSFLLPFFCVTLSQERLSCGALRIRSPLLKIVVRKNGNVKEHERTCPERPSCSKLRSLQGVALPVAGRVLYGGSRSRG